MNWIKCSDRLPLYNEDVLVFDYSDWKKIYVAYRSALGTWFCVCECHDGSSLINVTHWMPLPDPPEDL